MVSIADERPFVAPTHSASAAPGTGSRRSTHRPAAATAPAPHARSAHRHGHDHPDPRIVVDVPAAQGNVQAADVQRAARAKGYGVIRHCYEEGLRRNQHLTGHVTFDLAIGADGLVTDSPRRTTTLERRQRRPVRHPRDQPLS